MNMSPQDIQAKQFHVRFRGFDVEEVDSFLEQVAEHYLLLLEEKKALTNTVDSLTRELDSLKNDEHSFKDAIVSAQRVADEMRQKSQEQANALLIRAQDEVEELKNAAHKEIMELEYRVDELRGLQTKLRDDLRQVISSYLEQVEKSFEAPLPADSGKMEEASEAAQVDLAEEEALADLTEEEEEADLTEEELEAGPDLDDLYEKIDLGADGLGLSEDDEDYENFSAEDRTRPAQDSISIDLGDERATDSAIPDLDDEVMFTLEDPLDHDEIDVAIKENDPKNI